MTRQREHNLNCTDFSLWLRDQEQLDSKLGYVATDVDFVWKNYKTKQWLLLEEKTCMQPMTYCQSEILSELTKAVQNDRFFCGFYLIQFENQTPDDGKICINKQNATKADLISLLLFDKKTLLRYRALLALQSTNPGAQI